jgi:geranylgeranyl diphosphate synthase type II
MTEIKKIQSLIEKEIKKQAFGKKPDSLYEPIRYLMNLGGKRLRPVLTVLAYSLYKKDIKKIIPYAVALEAFHNFTLMHDDIMDKAPLRRGKPTVHKKWNTNTAILSGDVMLVRVYEMFNQLEADKVKKIISLFSACAAEVCEGQQWDMEFEKMSRVSELAYLQMIRQKTAELLGFSLELGARLADAPDEDCKALRNFGISIGIGFQLKDDLLDVYGDSTKVGKQVGGDILANKKTYLLIKALERANPKQAKEFHFWLDAKRPSKNEKINAITALYDQLNIETLTQKKADSYFKKGFKQLDKVQIDHQKKIVIDFFAKELIKRQH